MSRVGRVCIAALAAFLAAVVYIAFDILQQPNHRLGLSTEETMRQAGYRYEKHEILTEDGYLLTAFRIPGGKDRPVIWLQHGLTGSSDNYVHLGQGEALAFVLADQGYDVWIGNARGNSYSLDHTSYTIQDAQFWDFSWDEMGKYDIPAVLDHVRNVTKQEKVYYTGHSMGIAMLMVLLTTRPEYQERVELVFALAPAVFMEHSRSPIFTFFCRYYGTYMLNRNGPGPFLPSNFSQFQNWFWPTCSPENWASVVCQMLYVLTSGPSTEYNKDLLPAFLSSSPSQTSLKALAHYGQSIQSGKFRAFDYTTEGNEMRYGSSKSPSYDFKNVTTPFVIIFADNDYIVTPNDEYELCLNIKNVVEYYRVPVHSFNHMDFLYGKSAKKLVYNKILEILDKGSGVAKLPKAKCHK